MTIRTSDNNPNSNALLLWQGTAMSDNFIAIGLKDGQIEFKWFSGFTFSTNSIVEQGTSKYKLNFAPYFFSYYLSKTYSSIIYKTSFSDVVGYGSSHFIRLMLNSIMTFRLRYYCK